MKGLHQWHVQIIIFLPFPRINACCCLSQLSLSTAEVNWQLLNIFIIIHTELIGLLGALASVLT